MFASLGCPRKEQRDQPGGVHGSSNAPGRGVTDLKAAALPPPRSDFRGHIIFGVSPARRIVASGHVNSLQLISRDGEAPRRAP